MLFLPKHFIKTLKSVEGIFIWNRLNQLAIKPNFAAITAADS